MKLDIPDRAFGGYIFDCDGTIADNMPLHYRAWSMAMADFGGEYPEELFYAWGGRPTAVIVGLLNEKYGLALDVDETVRRKEKYYLSLIPEVVPVPEVLGIVKSIHGTVPLSVASGGHRELVEATLDVLGIRDLFQAIVCAEDYKRGKPHPEPFLLAAKLMSVPPEDCVVFEDSPIGIEAAKAANMAWVHVPGPLER
ncbi:MAG: haloacid dehalogenase [Spartobacteria bacterium AMD-G4]|nr:MAG: haloacid dehalogenase [Spartobacteria bacterium AMD-G4]